VNCSQTQHLLHAYLDGELDLVRHLEIEHHLADCARCTEVYESHQALHNALASPGLYARAPASLKERVRASLSGATEPSAPEPAAPARRAFKHWRGLTAVAAGIAAVVLGLGYLWLVLTQPWSTDELLAQQIVASHVRSLQLPEHRLDVASSDQHVVKPWFNGRVDFSPTVTDFAAEKFPLLGGRLDYLDHRPVAALVYQRNQHYINLFVWPGAPDKTVPLRPLERQGYHLLRWEQRGLNYAVISDLNAEELGQFVRLVRDAAAP
jgi:anti-sigma factor RsiW